MSRSASDNKKTTRLSPERIIDCAIAIVDQEGLNGLTMRRLGRQLDVDPMAIYHHLPNKQALITGMVKRVFDDMRHPLENTETSSWQHRIHAWGQAYREIARDHPNLVIHLVTDVDAAIEGMLATTEGLYDALAETGLPSHDIMRVADLIVDYIHGVILSEGTGGGDYSSGRAQLRDRINAEPAEQYPAIRNVLDTIEEKDLGIDVEFGLNVIIAGIEKRVQERSTAPRKST